MPSMRPQIKQVSVLGHGGFRKLSYAEWGSPKAARTVVRSRRIENRAGL